MNITYSLLKNLYLMEANVNVVAFFNKL